MESPKLQLLMTLKAPLNFEMVSNIDFVPTGTGTAADGQLHLEMFHVC